MPTDSLRAAIDALEALEREIAPGVLNVYRWWRSDVTLPAVWNWLTPGSVERPDDCTVRDLLRLHVTIAVDPTSDVAGDMWALEEYIDSARAILDAALYVGRPLDGAVKRARRLGIQTVNDRLGDVNVLAAELILELTLDDEIE